MTTELWIRVSDVRSIVENYSGFITSGMLKTDFVRGLIAAINSYAKSAGKPSPEPTESDVERTKLRREMALAICLQIIVARAGDKIDLGDVPDCALKMADTLIAGETK